MNDIHRLVWESLISSRNILLSGKVNERISPCLEKIIISLDSLSVGSTNKIIKFCVREALIQIEISNYLGAGLILNLIHNMPLDAEGEEDWDIDYFLSMELVSFLENFDQIPSARKIVLFVCSQLYPRYL